MDVLDADCRLVISVVWLSLGFNLCLSMMPFTNQGLSCGVLKNVENIAPKHYVH